MRQIITFLFVFTVFTAALHSQTAEIKNMRKNVGNLEKQIAEKENILLSSKKDIDSKLKNLNLLTAQINERKELIAMLVGEVKALNTEINRLNIEVADKEKRVEISRGEYAAALNRSRRYGDFSDKLLFIVSANDFNSMLRRYRYTREYMQAYKRKGEELREAVAALQAEKALLDSTVSTKKTSLDEQERQRFALQELENRQRTLVKELKGEQRKVEKELADQRKKLAKLNAEIERAIDREMEARKRAEEQKKKQIADTKKADNSESSAKSAVANKKVDAGVKKMSGTFLANKGKLPMPITGPYHIVSTFGLQKGVAGKGTVQIDYGGIVLEGERGAKARCIFDGEVTSVIRHSDYAFVLVRHDKYISVYCRLADIVVKEGDILSAGDILGTVATDASGHTCLQFQLRNEKTKLNPMQWLKIG